MQCLHIQTIVNILLKTQELNFDKVNFQKFGNVLSGFAGKYRICASMFA